MMLEYYAVIVTVVAVFIAYRYIALARLLHQAAQIIHTSQRYLTAYRLRFGDCGISNDGRARFEADDYKDL